MKVPQSRGCNPKLDDLTEGRVKRNPTFRGGPQRFYVHVFVRSLVRGEKPIESSYSWFLPKLASVKSRWRLRTR